MKETEFFDEFTNRRNYAKDFDYSLPIKFDPATKYHKDKNMVIHPR